MGSSLLRPHRVADLLDGLRMRWLTAAPIRLVLRKRSAGPAGKIPHDFRRTTVRNLDRAGAPRSAAMAMVGHPTESIYRRYAIAAQGTLKESAVKLAALHAFEQGGKRVVHIERPKPASSL